MVSEIVNANIQPLSTSAIDRICASQVIPNIHSCVRELIENSLDAGAGKISVRIRNGGLDLEVADDGCGIEEVDWTRLCEPHSTSKIAEFADIAKQSAVGHGFRGEALSAICSLSSEVKVITRTESMDSGRLLAYNDVCRLVKKDERISKSVGTTVLVSGLFQNSLPVRFVEAQKNFKKEVKLLSHLLTELAVIQPGKAFELLVDGTCVMTSPGGLTSSYEAYKRLMNGEDLVEFFCHCSDPEFEVTGWITPAVPTPLLLRPLSGTGSRPCQFMYLNARPINVNRRILKVLQSVYAKYNIKKVAFILKIRMANRDRYDVNISVNKRDVLFAADIENDMVRLIEEKLVEIFDLRRNTKPPVAPVQFRSSFLPSRDLKRARSESPVADLNRSEVSQEYTVDSKSLNEQEALQPVQAKGPSISLRTDTTRSESPFADRNRYEVSQEYTVDSKSLNEQKVLQPVQAKGPSITPRNDTNKSASPRDSYASDKAGESMSDLPARECPNDTPSVSLNEISLRFDKGMFMLMDIVGQFNNGFIVTRVNSQLFLVDQHAANEKYLFEYYNDNIVIKPQVLIAPIRLKVSPALEDTIQEYETELGLSGFRTRYHEKEPRGQRFHLISLPTLSGVGFNRSASLLVSDFLEIVDALDGECIMDVNDAFTGPHRLIRLLSSVRATFASKACRTAVMVGDSLSTAKMNDIITSLTNLHQPWNCPHGRPTLKHLLDVTEIDKLHENS